MHAKLCGHFGYFAFDERISYYMISLSAHTLFFNPELTRKKNPLHPVGL